MPLEHRIHKIISISPNPVADFMNISCTDQNLVEPFDFYIYDSKGQLMLNGLLNKKQYNISALPGGNYLLKVTNSGYSQTIKFVKPEFT